MNLPKIALYGGAFDPVHTGHTSVIHFLRKKFSFSKIILIPSGDNQLKKAKASSQHRLNLLKLAVKNEKDIEINTFEVIQKGPHFTSKTLDAIKNEKNLSRDEITFILGSDQFIQFEQWKNFPEILSKSHWLILTRKMEQDEKSRLELKNQKMRFISLGILKRTSEEHTFETIMGTTLRFTETDVPMCSSTEIRRELAIHGELKNKRILDQNVYEYLMENELYGTKHIRLNEKRKD